MLSQLVCSSARSSVRSFVRSLAGFFAWLCTCFFVHAFCSFDRSIVRSFLSLFVCLFVRLSFVVVLRDFVVGSAMARVTRNRIYEKAGGKGREVGRQIGHHRITKHKEPQEATGVQL